MSKASGSVGLVAVLLGSLLPGCGPSVAANDEGALATSAQALSEGAPMVVHDASCLKLQDQNTWSTYASYLSGVGVPRSMSDVLLDLNRAGPMLTAFTHPPVVGYKGGFRWNDGDMATTEWIPQGMTAGVVGSKNVVMMAWHYSGSPDKGVRISVADISDMSLSSVGYRHVLLVRPSSAGDFVEVPEHAGGLAWCGSYLYMADTADGIRVFDLTRIREVNTSAPECATNIGRTVTSSGSTVHCAYGYKYILPQVSAYVVPSSITSPCRPKFSFLGKDTRGSVPVVLSGEYCNTSTAPCAYDGSTPGLGGRLYRWPVDATTNRLKTVGGYVSPERAYFMNEMYVQGVAAIMTRTSTGAYKYPADAYWLNASRHDGSLFKVGTAFSRTMWRAIEAEWLFIPQGMHATATGTNLWVNNEGYDGSTNPATGGRVVIYVDQAAVD